MLHFDLFGAWPEDADLHAALRQIGTARKSSGTRKDFVDLAFLLKSYAIPEIFDWYVRKYPDASVALALRSMAYFVDAETMPLPRMLLPFDWEEAKETVRASVREMVGHA